MIPNEKTKKYRVAIEPIDNTFVFDIDVPEMYAGRGSKFVKNYVSQFIGDYVEWQVEEIEQ